MKTRQSTFPLRLPNSVKTAVEQVAKSDGISVNQFIATAVSEKLSVMMTASYFADRQARADFAAFDRIMSRSTGEAPRADDVLDDDLIDKAHPID
jgi:hypothetical protein